jgi:phosphoglycolate phosphatase
LSISDDNNCAAVFFDLDGTLVDTAPDMVTVLQEMQRDHGIDPIAYELARSNVSNGALGLLKAGFPDISNEQRQGLVGEYVERYSLSVCRRTTLFPGMPELLSLLEQANIPWGVVTNKPARLTDPLLEALGLMERAASAISGDTLPKRKPDPAPLFHACQEVGVSPGESIYVGDAARDIEAGLAAGMMTIAAAYGYITADDCASRWGAHQIAADTQELAKIVLKAVNLLHR